MLGCSVTLHALFLAAIEAARQVVIRGLLKQPAGRGPEGCVENGSAASLLVSHVSIQICSFSASPARTASQTTHFERNETQEI